MHDNLKIKLFSIQGAWSFKVKLYKLPNIGFPKVKIDPAKNWTTFNFCKTNCVAYNFKALQKTVFWPVLKFAIIFGIS